MSIFIQPDDFETFRQLLACDEVPEKYAKEYYLRLNAFHKTCGSGPLGNLAVIDLLRFCGWLPANAQETVEETDWDQVKRGQRVEAKYNGLWLGGEFLGFGEHRVLLVKLDENEYVKECRRHMVRLSNAAKPAPVELKEDTLPPEQVEMRLTEDLQPEGSATADLLEHPPLASPQWETAEVGEEVWTEINGELQECKFTKLLPDGQITVTFDGELYTLPSEKVTRAALSTA